MSAAQDQGVHPASLKGRQVAAQDHGGAFPVLLAGLDERSVALARRAQGDALGDGLQRARVVEHAVVPDNDDPLRNTRTTLANPVERLFIAPYWVNYHLEHHLFMFVPCWRLPAAHRLLIAGGQGPRMEIQRGYRVVLRLAASLQFDGKRGEGPRSAAHI